MNPTTDTSPAGTRENAQFTTTHWNVVLAAGGPESPEARQALERLCQSYWYPLYAYLRRNGKSEADAKDLTQGFFSLLLQGNDLGQVQRVKGKFRSFLLASLNNFLCDVWDKVNAQKRGGGETILSLDDFTGEDRYHLEPADVMDPEKLYERRWAMTVLDQAWLRLQEEFTQAGNSVLFERLKDRVAGEKNDPTYAQIAAELQRAEGTIKSDVHRMRERFRELVREEVANTVSSPEEVNEELRHLFRVFSR